MLNDSWLVPFYYGWHVVVAGVMPQTFIVVRAGLTLQDIKSPSDVLDIRAFITLALLAFLALIPTLKPVQNVLDRLLTRTDNKNKHHWNVAYKNIVFSYLIAAGWIDSRGPISQRVVYEMQLSRDSTSCHQHGGMYSLDLISHAC